MAHKNWPVKSWAISTDWWRSTRSSAYVIYFSEDDVIALSVLDAPTGIA
jgi:hypothetical protein